ncbi:MAG: methyltransferase domain-containing protein [Desulfobacterales bacterium]|jgi:ubiquinone/menaquinone biosynthesis C-methylase UbiE
MKRHVQEKRYYQDAFISTEDVILKQLLHEGIDIHRLSEDVLTRFDQIDHVGQIKNTRILEKMVDLKPDMWVLDVGGGLGGAARYLAHKYNCKVNVIDLVPDRCRGGLKLTHLTGLAHSVSYQAADAQHIPFRDETFHFVWSQDAFDGVEDKALLLTECWRVLKPRGELVFTDHLRGSNEAVPDGIYLWPDDTSRFTFEDYRVLLKKQGFSVLEEIDLTEWALNSLRRVTQTITGAQRLEIQKAQGFRYYQKLVAFIDSFRDYLKSGAVHYGAFKVACKKH